MGTSVGGTLADFTEFDRKNYFYPDIPKGYQISQYQYPLIKGGTLKGVEITRVHLEEDTARSYHKEDYSLIDFNRAGVPLMELVTEPVIHSAKEAGDFARELQILLRTLRAGEANMEKGQMRIEANISVGKEGKRGTKVEVKNLNSFRSVERAIEYEVNRQIELLEKGEKVVQETRGWDEVGQKTFSQRLKEESHDYRYFPDPDLPKLHLSEIPDMREEVLKSELPELPWLRRERLAKLGFSAESVEVFLTDTEGLFSLPEKTLELVKDEKEREVVINLSITNLFAHIKQDGGAKIKNILPGAFAKLAVLRVSGLLSSSAAVAVFESMYEKGGDPESLAREKGLIQQSDSKALESIADAVISKNPTVAAEYRGGKLASLQFLVGQGMRESKGSANPGVLRRILEEKLK